MVLSLPFAAEDGSATGLVTALFTSTSAVCVTGLAVVDTGTYWSGFGEAVILGLIQVGGFGIMTLASLLGLLVSGSLGLRMQLTAQAETKSLGSATSAGCCSASPAPLWSSNRGRRVLALRFRYGYGKSLGGAVYLGYFHAVSAFNNAGFGLHADSLTRYAQDPWVTLPIAAAVILGGLGFPVLFELLRHGTPRTTGAATGRCTRSSRWSPPPSCWLPAPCSPVSSSGPTPAHSARTPAGKILDGFFHSAMPAPPASTPSTSARCTPPRC